MRIGVLSNGPSLSLYGGGQRPDTLIGCGPVVERHACDWWAFCDYESFRDVRPVNRPKLFTRGAAITNLLNLAPELMSSFRGYDLLLQDTIDFPQTVPPWNIYSGVAGLALAIHLAGPGGDVHLFGFDMGGDDDAMGRPSSSRTDARWKIEWNIYDQLLDVARSQNVSVTRWTPDLAEARA